MAVPKARNSASNSRFCWGVSLVSGLISSSESSTKLVRSIYQVSGAHQKQRQNESADSRAVNIFKKMDVNSDGVVTREEFVTACLADTSLMQMLTPQTGR